MSSFSLLIKFCQLRRYSYGVSRVYSRQYGYVLSDAQLVQANLRTLLKAVRTSELDPNAGKARQARDHDLKIALADNLQTRPARARRRSGFFARHGSSRP